jgi:hypothetical protein
VDVGFEGEMGGMEGDFSETLDGGHPLPFNQLYGAFQPTNQQLLTGLLLISALTPFA